MSWARLDDRANEHRKQLLAGPEACWMWSCGLMYANRQDARDGFIPEPMLAMLYPFTKPKKLAAKLVEVGLWEVVPGGYKVHNYEKWNETADERDVRLDIAARRRAVRNDPELYRKLKARDGLQCRYCGCAVDFAARRGPKSGTYDHVVPVVQGGGDGFGNLVVSCQACNLKKGGRTPEQAGMVLRPVPGSVPRSNPSTEPNIPGVEWSGEGSSSGSPEGEAGEDRETTCPPGLVETLTGLGVVTELAKAYGVPDSAVLAALAEFVSYWVLGAGAGKRRAHWPAKARERVREKHREGKLAGMAVETVDRAANAAKVEAEFQALRAREKRERGLDASRPVEADQNAVAAVLAQARAQSVRGGGQA